MPAGLGEQRDRDRADAAGRAGDDDRTIRGFQPVLLQCQNAKHRGVAGRTDRHGFGRGEPLRQRHQPIALDAALLRIGAKMGLAGAPAVQHHEIARLEVGMRGGLDAAGEVDAGDHRPAAHHRRLAADREAVLVVHRRMRDADGDVALHQFALGEIGEGEVGAGLTLRRHQGLERRHRHLPQRPVPNTTRLQRPKDAATPRCVRSCLFRIRPAALPASAPAARRSAG